MTDNKPFFSNHVFCCTNRREPGHTRGCCAEKDAEALRDYMKQQVKALKIPDTRINNAGCLDRCKLGPVMVIYPEGIWYSCKNRKDIDEVINEHLQNGRIVERLRLSDR